MLSVFWLVLTYSCNNRCLPCYAEPTHFENCQMPFSYAAEILDSMRKSGMHRCILIGGEPTLYPHLTDLIRIANNLKIKTILVTNGRKLKSERYLKSLIDAGITRIVISIEGSNSNIHNTITQTKSFNDTVSAIQNCVNMECEVCSLTTIQSINISDCINIPSFLQGLGMKNISFNCGIPSVGHDAKINATYISSPDKLARTIEAVYMHHSIDDINLDFNGTIPACLFSEDILNKMIKTKSISFGCQMYHGKGVVFDPKGNILPCTHFAEFPILKSAMDGSHSFIYKNNFLEVWNDVSKLPSKFRQKIWRYPSVKCVDCRYWGGCIGGCPLLWLNFNPREYVLNFIKKGGDKSGYFGIT